MNATCALGTREISGLKAEYVKYNYDTLDGNPSASKVCAGSISYFIPLGIFGKTLQIYKQSIGDGTDESDFENLIQSLKVE